ncbi:hypothetical protein BC827DRAFT_1183978 [Russula dissimulans]|nr:hypothetical protein BC827DRAFT_1183978 [Russula dissimulans]
MSFASRDAHALPPTSNKLDAVQRARIMRSSRKVGAVLGTTPFLLESCGSTVPVRVSRSSTRDAIFPCAVPSHVLKQHHRHYSVCEKSRASSSSESLPLPSLSRAAFSSKESLLSTSDSCTDESVVPLVVEVQPPCPSGALRPIILFNSAPLSSSDPHAQATPLSPNADVPTPTTPIEPSRAEARRRKMARVVRTLGERVPPELVFRSSDVDWEEYPPVPTTAAAPTPLERRSTSRLRSNPKGHRRRSASVGSSPHWQRLLDLPEPVFSSGAKAPADQRWVGEWNRRNIAQVQRELRALRTR